MKKNFFILIFLLICTSSSYCENISEKNNLNIIINSEKVYASPIIYKDYTLIPIRQILPFFNIQNENIHYANSTITIKRYNSVLTLKINDINGYINSNKIQLPVAPILYENTTYLPLRVISDFFDCYTYYDSNTQTIFIKDLNEYQQIESFFQKVQNRLYFVDYVQIDIINEIKNKTSNYSFGNSIYIDKKTNSVFQKNILDSDWKKSNMKVNTTINGFNNNFFAGLSFDRTKSSDSQMVFCGFYPTNSGTLCKSTIYLDTATRLITKQISEFSSNDMSIKQNVLYSYN